MAFVAMLYKDGPDFLLEKFDVFGRELLRTRGQLDAGNKDERYEKAFSKRSHYKET